ncbi:MAG: hypothetical protein DRR08_17165 [Candidatus Parabeggiatoa sp. nov. 2]|nr:MAG: hypothetical protein DRR08_17165 [Gammaproteobacteria bacterium]HEC86131.1 hypothetical protein [Thioploca sp.]
MNKEFITLRLGSFPKGTDFIISITRNSLPEVGQGEAQQYKDFGVSSKKVLICSTVTSQLQLIHLVLLGLLPKWPRKIN